MEVRMSLRKSQTMTPEKISANRRNARHSHGPAAPERRRHIRAAHQRHGFYAGAEEWEARERQRQLLENTLTRQVEICEAHRKAILKESVAGPSRYERGAEIALAHPNAALMQRMEESSFRQIWRITNLLLKLRNPSRGPGRPASCPVTP